MSDDLDMATNLLTAKEVAKMLRVTPLTLARWRKAGRGPYWVRRGTRAVGYRPEDVQHWMNHGPEATRP